MRNKTEDDEDTDRRKSTQVRWGGRDGRRELDSGLGYTQDWHSQWTTDGDRETEGRQMGDRIPEITGICRNSQWDFPRRRALFTSDGTYSRSSESETSDNSPARLAEYKRQFQRVARQPGDDPSIFAIELETLARREFMDVDLKIQLQMVRYRFIDGQADRSLRRHLDSLGPNTPMIEMVDSCRIWERHCEPEIRPRMGADRGPVHMTGQVSEDRPIPAIPSDMESVKEMIRRLLPTPATLPLQAAPKYADRDILVRQLMETICPPMLVAQERPPTNDLETPSFNRFSVGIVTEEDSAQPELLSDSTEGCFSCGEWTHNTEQCQALDESFPFLPIGWVAESNENTFILGPGPPSSPRSHKTGNDDWSGERGWSPGSAMSTDPNSQ